LSRFGALAAAAGTAISAPMRGPVSVVYYAN
jgi:hypothetical protein